MISPQDGVWYLPTRRRFDKLTKFLQSAEETCRTTYIVLLVQEEELQELRAEYDAICARFSKIAVKATKSEGMAAKIQEAYAECPVKASWIGILADDLIARTVHWDVILLSQLNGYNFVSADDGWQAPRRIGGGGIALSGDLVRAIGYIVPDGIKHLYWDDFLETLGRDMGIWQFCPDVLMEHKHASLEVKPIDANTAILNSFLAADEKAYRIWRYKDREGASKRIADLMRSKGVEMLDTDLSNVRLLITSPSPRPEFDAGFMDSVLNTIELVKRCGGFADFYKLPGTSDIVYGRAVLLTSFINSGFTHNLQVDSDMVFNPMDVVRMLKKNEPFIAAAGPRKGDVGETIFAFTNADDRGHTRPAEVRGDMVAEVTEVGGAFVLVDQRFVATMTAKYPELQFQDASGRLHYSFWLPTIDRLRYRGEDYSMCKRWREAGGKVLIDLNVRLGHTGVKTWYGAAMEQVIRENAKLQEQQAEMAEAAE